MEKVNEIKLPKGVDRIAVKQHDDKIVIEFIPEEAKFKRGDILISMATPGLIVIFDKITSTTTFDSIYHNGESSNHGWRLSPFRHATKEEKQEFFDELKAEGKRWNAEAMKIEEILKKGDWAIFWDNRYLIPLMPLIRLYHCKTDSGNRHIDDFGTPWDNAVKWDGTKEQFEKVSRGEI